MTQKTITEKEWLKKGPFGKIPKTKKEFEALSALAEEDLNRPIDPATCVRVVMGRPKKSEGPAPSMVKAIRLPLPLLEQLQARAKAEGQSMNALLQTAVAEYLMHHRRA